MSVSKKVGQLVGRTINDYNKKTKPVIDDIKFKEKYQGRIIDCMVGEVDDNYIEAPATDNPITKLEHSKEGVVKMPTMKGKTILVDAEGNETDTPAEGCRLVSVGEEEGNKLIILSKNKNICDEVVLGDIMQTDGSFRPSTSVIRSDYIKVKPGCNYKLSDVLVANSDWCAIFEYDINKKLIKYHYNKTMTLTNSTHYVAFKYHNGDNINSKFQFEEGINATPYVAPQSHKAEISLDEPLRGLPNGVCDEIVGNKLIRRVGRALFNGSENWTKYGTGENESFITYNARIECTDTHLKSKQMWAQEQNNRGKSNSFKSIGDKVYFNTLNTEGFCQGFSDNAEMNGWCIAILKNKLKTQDVNGFKQWLHENPTEIIYELVEPIITELPNSITLQGFDDTTMYIENSITPTVQYGYNALIPYKEGLRTQREEVNYNASDIENNIIPYLMDMEFNLMVMEEK